MTKLPRFILALGLSFSMGVAASALTKAEAHEPLSLDHLDVVTLTRLGTGANRRWTVRLQGSVPLLVEDMPPTPLDDLSPMDLPAQPQVEALLTTLCLPGAAARAKLDLAVAQ